MKNLENKYKNFKSKFLYILDNLYYKFLQDKVPAGKKTSDKAGQKLLEQNAEKKKEKLGAAAATAALAPSGTKKVLEPLGPSSKWTWP